MLFAEVELVDDVTGIEGGDQSLRFHLHVVVEVCMTADVEIARYFLHSEWADQSASIFIAYGLTYSLHLPWTALLPQ